MVHYLKMTQLAELLKNIETEFSGRIAFDSYFFKLVDLKAACEERGIEDSFKDVKVIIPLNYSGNGSVYSAKEVVWGAQLDSGIVIPEWVAREAGVSTQPYRPNGSVVIVE